LRAEDFVLAEDEEEEADADANYGECAGVLGVRGERHRWMIVKANPEEKKKKELTQRAQRAEHRERVDGLQALDIEVLRLPSSGSLRMTFAFEFHDKRVGVRTNGRGRGR